MDIEDVILLIEKIMINQTGRTLSDTDITVIKGLHEGLTYSAIAENYNYHNGYVGEKSRSLYRVMTAELGYPVTKHNFRWVIDRLEIMRKRERRVKQARKRLSR